MPTTIISDTSYFIVLNDIGEFELLRRVFGKVVTTKDVADEFRESLPDWIEIMSAKDTHYQKILELQVDKGEASAIALGIEIADSVLILDDYKARKAAEGLGLQITGTIGVVIRAKLMGIITSIKPIIGKIKKTNFRISDEIISKAYDEAGEI